MSPEQAIPSDAQSLVSTLLMLVLALGVSTLASYVAFDLARRVRVLRTRAGALWLLGSAANPITWLDPARSYLPARATLGNSSGSPEYDLLLSRIDP